MNFLSSIGAWFASSLGSFNVNPQNFLNNMHYMGQGMLSIFIVIGVIIIVTYLVNKVTTLKKNK